MLSHDKANGTCVSGSNAWDASALHAAILCDGDGHGNKRHAPSIDVASGKS